MDPKDAKMLPTDPETAVLGSKTASKMYNFRIDFRKILANSAWTLGQEMQKNRESMSMKKETSCVNGAVAALGAALWIDIYGDEGQMFVFYVSYDLGSFPGLRYSGLRPANSNTHINTSAICPHTIYDLILI